MPMRGPTIVGVKAILCVQLEPPAKFTGKVLPHEPPGARAKSAPDKVIELSVKVPPPALVKVTACGLLAVPMI